MDETHGQVGETALLDFCSDAEVLSLLGQPTAVRQFAKILRTRELTPSSGAEYHSTVNGYKLVLGAALYGLLQAAVCWPDILGIEDSDPNLLNWWQYVRTGGSPALHAAFTDGKSKQARLVSRIAEHVDSVRSADSMPEFRAVARRAGNLGKLLGTAARRSTPSRFDRASITSDVEEILKLRSIERFLDYLEFSRTLETSYGFIWRGADQDDGGTYGSFESIATHLDYIAPFGSGREAVLKWKSGVITAMLIALQQLHVIEDSADNPDLFQDIMSSLISLTSLLMHIIGEKFPSREFGLMLPLPLSSQDWRRLQATTRPVTAKQQLEALVGNDSRTLIADESVHPSHLHLVLAGATSLLKRKDKLQLVRVRHSDTSDGLTWYSMAVQIPSPNSIVNLSKWWVFYKVYEERAPRNRISKSKALVDEVLAQFEPRIAIRELSDISLGDFLDICEPAAWRHLLKAGRRLENTNSRLKGLLPELLAAIQLTHEGYQNIRIRAKLTKLNNMEFDVVGVKQDVEGYKVMVVEVKGRGDSIHNVKREIEGFSSKVNHLRLHSSQLTSALGYGHGTQAIGSVSGRFVAMTEMESLTADAGGVEVWDYNRFTSELIGSYLPRWFLDLLQPWIMIQELNWHNLEERIAAEHSDGSPIEHIGLASLLGLPQREPW